VSFKQSQLDAWVYMPGGVFKWAIIKACGNPVTANAVPLVVGKGGGVTPTPTPPASVPKPIPVPPKTTPKTGGSESGLSLIGLMAIVLASWQYRRSRKELALAIRQN
jgi:hypothetical protein